MNLPCQHMSDWELRQEHKRLSLSREHLEWELKKLESRLRVVDEEMGKRFTPKPPKGVAND